jgi:peptidoglycan/xylan/chitin deacetylase (PgdA/CDA1 family)
VAAATSAEVVVSFTFDDGFADELNGAQILAQKDMRGTFYINSGRLDGPGRLTTDDVKALALAGHEIGGHTLDHQRLVPTSQDEQLRQICDDRVALTRLGLDVADFAYPYGDTNEAVEASVAQCGYASARVTGGLGLLPNACGTGCQAAESVPPGNIFRIRAVPSVVSTTTVDQIEQYITDAEQNGGGWVPLVFHNICDGCSSMGFPPHDLRALVDWLDARRNASVRVATVAQVLSATPGPVVAGPPDRRPFGEISNPSLENLFDPGAATVSGDAEAAYEDTAAADTYCWEAAGYGDNDAVWRRSRNAHSGSWAEEVRITRYVSGDRKFIVREDSGSCAPRAAQGKRYVFSAWYTSTASTRLIVFYRNTRGGWAFWKGSPVAPASSSWTQLRWTSPPLPADATHVTFGLQLAATGTLTTDDYEMRPVPGRQPAPLFALGGAGTLVLLVLWILWVRLLRRRAATADPAAAAQRR